MHVVIMAGGSGTRFWPRSRCRRPKQLIRVTGARTMLQNTVERVLPAVPPDHILVVTGADHAEESASQLSEHPGIRIVAEPEGRDTAACIGLAAVLLARDDPDAVFVATPADHIIEPAERFRRALAQAEEIVRRRRVFVTLGIPPRSASTQFGYIERGAPLDEADARPFPAYRVAAFREKPDAETAARFVASGRFYWNSGTFIWHVADILAAIERHLPALHAGLRRIADALGTEREPEVLRREYAGFEKVSIDYGVMEKTPDAAVLEVDYEWDDVGSWEAIPRLCGRDERGNSTQGATHLHDSDDCIVISDERHLVSTVGVRGLVVVHSPDATLVCRRDRVADVKALVSELRSKGYHEYL